MSVLVVHLKLLYDGIIITFILEYHERQPLVQNYQQKWGNTIALKAQPVKLWTTNWMTRDKFAIEC
jgi:hypothetical protein